ncbi:hypothetical protein S2091_3371 [Solimicrobium silvestre]|uniref:Uncharacterized protein n=2 Tax=Solimicrobium silvestre TaxID=2099400 RepID=A0A2S9GWC9_9BURK|nr:hypothetical protein S2091_3371 [Solimicrobium silvestre]
MVLTNIVPIRTKPPLETEKQATSHIPTIHLQKLTHSIAITGEQTPSTSENPAVPLAPTESPNRLDLEALRNQAVVDDKNRIRSPQEKTQGNETLTGSLETHLADAAERGAKKDCKTTYADNSIFTGLARLIPITYGALTDKCKL